MSYVGTSSVVNYNFIAKIGFQKFCGKKEEAAKIVLEMFDYIEEDTTGWYFDIFETSRGVQYAAGSKVPFEESKQIYIVNIGGYYLHQTEDPNRSIM